MLNLLTKVTLPHVNPQIVARCQDMTGIDELLMQDAFICKQPRCEVVQQVHALY